MAANEQLAANNVSVFDIFNKQKASTPESG